MKNLLLEQEVREAEITTLNDSISSKEGIIEYYEKGLNASIVLNGQWEVQFTSDFLEEYLGRIQNKKISFVNNYINTMSFFDRNPHYGEIISMKHTFAKNKILMILDISFNDKKIPTIWDLTYSEDKQLINGLINGEYQITLTKIS